MKPVTEYQSSIPEVEVAYENADKIGRQSFQKIRKSSKRPQIYSPLPDGLYYLNEDWIRFDKQGEEIFSQYPNFNNPLQRRDYYFQILRMFFMHLFVDDSFIELTKELNYTLIDMYKKNANESYAFLNSIVNSVDLKNFERDIFERIYLSWILFLPNACSWCF